MDDSVRVRLIAEECERAKKRLRAEAQPFSWLFETLADLEEDDPPLTAIEASRRAGRIGSKQEHDSQATQKEQARINTHAARLNHWLADYHREREKDGDYFIRIERLPSKFKLKFSAHKEPTLVDPAATAALQVTVAMLQQQSILLERLLMPNIDSAQRVMRIGQAEWSGSEEECAKTFEDARKWLATRPDDVFVRGAIIWATLTRGDVKDMLDVVHSTLEWLLLDSDKSSKISSKVTLQSDSWERILDDNAPGPAIFRNFVERHLEDTLVRATFLHWMKGAGRQSELGRKLALIKTFISSKRVQRFLLKMMGPRKATGSMSQSSTWLSTSITKVVKLVAETGSPLFRVCYLWLVARARPKDSLIELIEKTFVWLARHDKDTLVRPMAIWMISDRLTQEQFEPFVPQIDIWLTKDNRVDDSLVWVAFLYLIGTKGTKSQVDDVINHVTRWLHEFDHRDDNFVRVAFLLFVMQRRGTVEQRTAVIKEAQIWMQAHPHDRITAHALDMVRKRLDIRSADIPEI